MLAKWYLIETVFFMLACVDVITLNNISNLYSAF